MTYTQAGIAVSAFIYIVGLSAGIGLWAEDSLDDAPFAAVFFWPVMALIALVKAFVWIIKNSVK